MPGNTNGMAEHGEADERFIEGGEEGYITKNVGPRYISSRRFKFGITVFVANILLYIHRVNLNMAIVCMLDATEVYVQEAETTTWKENKTTVLSRTEIFNKSFNGIRNHNFTDYSSAKPFDVQENESRFLFNDVSKTNWNNFTMATKTMTHKQQFEFEFNWSKAQVSLLLSASYYGAVFSEVLGGYLAHRFGGKHVISTCLISSALCSILSPVAASSSYAFIFIIRIILGFSGGLFTPAMYSLMMYWTTPTERASVLSFSLSGQPSGIVLAYVTSGFLCSLGWSTIFYVHGGVTLAFMLLWLYEIRSVPGQHPRISQAEKDYLTRSTPDTSKKSVPPTPWRSILLSRPQWAVTLVHFVFNWSLFTVVINIPLFLKEAFDYIISENGVFSALPYVFSAVTWMFSGTLSAAVIRKRLLSVQATRKTMTAISLAGSAVCLICAGHVTYELRFLAVALVCVSCIFGGLSYGGYIPSYTEYAGIFSGTAFAITNALADGAVIISATVAGLLTPNGLQKEWQNVFYLAAGLNVIGGIVYCIYGEATLQEWAKVDECDQATNEIEITANDVNGTCQKE